MAKASHIRRIDIGSLAMVAGESAVHDDVERLLFTRPNEAVGFLRRGCRLLDFLDAPADEATATAALDEVIACVAAYMPQISLTQAQVDIDGRGLVVSIEYEYEGNVYRAAYSTGARRSES